MEVVDGTFYDIQRHYEGDLDYRKSFIPPKLNISLFSQLIDNLFCLKSLGLIYADIKPDNIGYVCTSKNLPPLVQILDIGSAHPESKARYSNNFIWNLAITMLIMMDPKFSNDIYVITEGYRRYQTPVNQKQFDELNYTNSKSYLAYKTIIDYLITNIIIPISNNKKHANLKDIRDMLQRQII